MTARRSRLLLRFLSVLLLGGWLSLAGCSSGEAPASESEESASVEEPAGVDAEEVDAQPAADVREPAPAPVASRGFPKIEFEREAHDYGQIYDIEVVKTAFKFWNRGDANLVISEVKPSCGCTATELDKKVYAPGESGEIVVEFSPRGFGRQSKYITITSNDPKRPVVRLTISATIQPFVKADPHQIRFEKVKHGEEHVTESQLISIDPEFEVVSVTSSTTAILAEVRDPLPDDPDTATKMLKVTLRDTAPWGRTNGMVTIKARGRLKPGAEPVTKDVRVNVFGEAYGDIHVDPAFYSVGLIQPGGEVDSEILLTHVNGEPFEVVYHEVKMQSDKLSGLKAVIEPTGNGDETKGVKVHLKGPVGTHLGLIRGSVILGTNVPGEPRMEIAVMGNVRDTTRGR